MLSIHKHSLASSLLNLSHCMERQGSFTTRLRTIYLQGGWVGVVVGGGGDLGE
jgi:hypothetical protein